jgi:hypothetical protein
VLKGLRPHVARIRDAALTASFNYTLDWATRGRKAVVSSGGDYASFTAAARSKAKDAKPDDETAIQKRVRELDAMYAERRRTQGVGAAKK